MQWAMIETSNQRDQVSGRVQEQTGERCTDDDQTSVTAHTINHELVDAAADAGAKITAVGDDAAAGADERVRCDEIKSAV